MNIFEIGSTHRLAETDTEFSFTFRMSDCGCEGSISFRLEHEPNPDLNELDKRAWARVSECVESLHDTAKLAFGLADPA